MCHNRTKINKTNRIHERCLRLIHNVKKLYFEDFLEKEKSVSINYENLSSLAIEMYKVHRGISSEFLNDLFPFKARRPT